MRMSIAGAAKPKITSSPGRRIWPPTEPHARRPRPINVGCPARRRILAHVDLAHVDAKAFNVARRAVRYVAPAAPQTRRASRRDEDDDQDSSADIMSSSGHFASRARAHPAPRHLKNGA